MINTASTTQIQQLFYGHYENETLINEERVFQSDKTEDEIAEEVALIKAENPYLDQVSRKFIITQPIFRILL